MRMTSANSPNGTVVGVGVEVSVSLVIASVSRSAPANRRPSGRRWCWLDTNLLILHHKETVMRKIYCQRRSNSDPPSGLNAEVKLTHLGP